MRLFVFGLVLLGMGLTMPGKVFFPFLAAVMILGGLAFLLCWEVIWPGKNPFLPPEVRKMGRGRAELERIYRETKED